MENDFDKLSVRKKTKRQAVILAAVRGKKVLEMVESVFDGLWQEEIKAGRVNDSMLQPADEPRYTDPVEAA